MTGGPESPHYFLPMETPPLALEFGSLQRSRFQRELTTRTSPRIRQFAVEKESHFNFIADGMQLGVDCLMEFTQPPDSMIRHTPILFKLRRPVSAAGS